ncbi:MAG: tyrosine-type recombinase/integrase [Proteobacteria bacterium]|nr:tyrosine-type recombinase/integrase [Pseudomonadota bacterium]
MSDSSRSAVHRKPTVKKPKKPYPTFPLFPHATKRWAKKIRQKLHYFGPWGDPNGSLEKYLAVKDRLHAGLPVTDEGESDKPSEDGLTINELCANFLRFKKGRIATGELSERTFSDYRKICKTLEAFFGPERIVETLTPTDFDRLRSSLAAGRGLVALRNHIRYVRILFNYAEDQDLIDKRVKLGKGFTVSKKAIDRAKESNPSRMFESDELRKIIKSAPQSLRTMVLLGINCAYGNTDVAKLTVGRIDFENGWIDYPRPKNGNRRRCKLWQETLHALRKITPETTAKSDLVFVTNHGNPYVRFDSEKGTAFDQVASLFSKLLRKIELNGPGKNFYALRHTFRTIADETHDLPAIRLIMGHSDPSAVEDAYRERIDDSRIEAVVNHVRTWLFGEGGE